jgi:threonyl-tRNA synthetase
MIHRVVFGSIERFIGILIEHYAGRFPIWLAPVQARVIVVSEAAADYANSVYSKLKEAGIRCEIDERNEKIGYKIREAQLQKIPYMLIVGDKELASGSVAVRSRDAGDLGTVPLDKFIAGITEEIRTRKSH